MAQIKKPAAERKIEAKQRLDKLAETLTSDQLEDMCDLIETIKNELPNIREPESINIKVTRQAINRMKIEVEDTGKPKLTHFEKVILGYCKRVHFASVLNNKKMSVGQVKRKAYLHIVIKDTDKNSDQYKIKMRRISKIYAEYHREVLRQRRSLREDTDMIDLQETYRDRIDVFRYAELLRLVLEGRRQKLSIGYAEALSYLLKIIYERQDEAQKSCGSD